jgi:hypothetical protein
MTERQPRVRSAGPRDTAHRLARREGVPVTNIAERAVEAYMLREVAREPAAALYARLSTDYSSDIDLEAVIRESRKITFWRTL